MESVEAENKTSPDLLTDLKGSQDNLALITRLERDFSFTSIYLLDQDPLGV